MRINQIGDAGAVGLGEGLKTNTVLQDLRYAVCCSLVFEKHGNPKYTISVPLFL
jgi:hypothetical protein